MIVKVVDLLCLRRASDQQGKRECEFLYHVEGVPGFVISNPL
jgi:hypothetical protein